MSVGGTVFLFGPRAEVSSVAEALSGGEQTFKAFSDSSEFLDCLFREPPWAVVVWENLVDDEAGMNLFDVLRHHLDGQDSLIVLVSADARGGHHPDCGAYAVLNAPVNPAELGEVLRKGRESRGKEGEHIPRVLVVDDDQNIVLLGSHIVSGMGMIPLVAFDGLQALDKVRTIKPDLILLDINMPVMDGFQVIEALKASSKVSLIPIIVFSARKDDEDKVRALRLGADDYVTKPFSLTELSARIDRLLKRTRTGLSASSTTGLPGSMSIEQDLAERIRRQKPLAVLYLDLDHFKTFNDCYGFARGDSLIRQTADLILSAVRELGNADDFVGHVGGDDFVVATTPTKAVAIADEVIAGFGRLAPLYYDAADRARGFVETEDRRGKRVQFPLATISISIVTNEGREFQHTAQISDVAAQLKKYAKAKPGSVWVKDQRGSAVL